MYAFSPVNLSFVSLLTRPQLQKLKRVGRAFFLFLLYTTKDKLFTDSSAHLGDTKTQRCVSRRPVLTNQNRQTTTNPKLPPSRQPPPLKALSDLLAVDSQTHSTPHQQDPISSIYKS